MSAPITGRDCKERIDELMNAARTMPDEHLISGMCNPGFQKKHARLEIPLVGIGQVFHENATSGFSNYSPVKYSSTTSKAYWPTGGGADILDAGLLGSAVNNATTRSVDFQPARGTMHEIHSIRMTASALAGNRTASLNWYDGVQTVPIWDSGGAQVATTADFLIYPVDISTYMTGAVDLIGSPPLKSINTQYLRWTNTDLAAAETLTIRLRYDTRDIGGLD